MGGDGGVIASNRRYMRSAGTAEASETNHDPTVQRQEVQRALTTCALTQQALGSDKAVCCCALGRLYLKEAAVEALLRKKQGKADELGDHIRGLKDLHDVRFHLYEQTQQPTCPVTRQQLDGQLPVYALLPGKQDQTNVLSEKALKILGDSLADEWGPVRHKIRLAPPPEILASIEADLQRKRDKKAKKRKHAETQQT